ncbi:hypothetical protein ABFX02_10G111701 [Erythranthe guttata]
MQQLQQMQQHPPLGDPMNSEGMMKMVENQRVSELPLEGFTFNSLLPLTGIDQIGTISGLRNPNLLTQNQFLLASQQQQAMNLKYHLLTSMQKMVSLSEIMDLRCNQIHKRPRYCLIFSMKMAQMQQSSSQQPDQLQQTHADHKTETSKDFFHFEKLVAYEQKTKLLVAIFHQMGSC